jgi:flagellar biosynthesis/type III secretory pathway ATPase
LAASSFNGLLQLASERAMPLSRSLCSCLERDRIEGSVITGSVATHECLDVFAGRRHGHFSSAGRAFRVFVDPDSPG